MVLRDLNGKEYTGDLALAIVAVMKDNHSMQYYDKKMRLKARLKHLDNLHYFRDSDMDCLYRMWDRLIRKLMA